MTVLKTDGRKQPFAADKIVRSMQVALRKRPVDPANIEAAAKSIIQSLEKTGLGDVSAQDIGEEVMKSLANLDSVGYIRYASVYKDFRDPADFDTFLSQARKMQEKNK